jgi:hypothetical protein
MRKNWIKGIALIALLIIMLSFTSKMTPVSSSPTTRIYLDPSNNIYDMTTAYIGKLFNVTIWVEDVSDVAAFQVHLRFNDTILNVTRWFEPRDDSSYIFYGKTTSALPSPPDPGYVHLGPGLARVQVGANLFPTPPTQPPSSGTGKLCIFEFNITALPPPEGGTLSSTLNINVTDTYLISSTGTKISGVIKENGYYEVSRPAPPTGSRIYVDPPEIIDPTLVPPKTISINITIDDIENLYFYEFNLSFNPSVLICLSAIPLDAMGETNYIPEITINNPKGFVWVRVTYYSPANPITTYDPLALTNIVFRIKAIGQSTLDLHDTLLKDFTDSPIPHDVYDGLIMTLIRDVAVTQVLPSRTWTYAGWPLNITVTVKNLGNINETFDIKTYYDNNLIDQITVTDLQPTEETSLNFTWDTTGVPEGTYTIKANVTQVPYESNTANNELTDGTVEIMTYIHDIAITNVTLSKEWVYQGNILNITVTAKNNGAFPESFDVNAYYDSHLIGTFPVTNLAPDVEIEVEFLLNTSTLEPCHTYVVKAEATIVEYEFNETNNIIIDGSFKVRFFGDVDGDGKVDIIDVYAVSAAFGSYPGSPKWNPDLDVNEDQRIDMLDIYLVAMNFGRGCPQ